MSRIAAKRTWKRTVRAFAFKNGNPTTRCTITPDRVHASAPILFAKLVENGTTKQTTVYADSACACGTHTFSRNQSRTGTVVSTVDLDHQSLSRVFGEKQRLPEPLYAELANDCLHLR
jgi:hypothetical protein